MYGNAQPLNLAKQWLRALPDAMPHGHQHLTMVVPEPASEGQNDQLFNFAPKVVGGFLSCLSALCQLLPLLFNSAWLVSRECIL